MGSITEGTGTGPRTEMISKIREVSYRQITFFGMRIFIRFNSDFLIAIITLEFCAYRRF